MFLRPASFIVFFLWVLTYNTNAQQVHINEFMSSNSSTVADEDGDFEDWLELYNAGSQAVNLSGYGLSDNLFQPYKWVFPDTVIAPGSYMLIWASGKNRSLAGAPLHTNWQISANGEYLILTDTSGTFVSFIHPVTLLSDISYGRYPNGSQNFLYFDMPTPESANQSDGYTELLAPVSFSQEGGFYTDSFLLSLSHPSPGAVIYYTLDGSEPDSANLNGATYQYQTQYLHNPGDILHPLSTGSFKSKMYDGQPINIYNRSAEPDKQTHIATSFWGAPHFPPYQPTAPVYKGTVVRAKAYKQGAIASPVKTHSFFIDSLARNRYANMAVISLAIDENLLFDYYKGFYVPGFIYEDIKLYDPSLIPNGGTDANHHQRGADWEYPMNIEIFEETNTEAFINQIAGSRIHGAWTRARPRKSLRLYARGMYGASEFKGSVFPNQEYSSYKRLILRNGGNNEHLLHFRDVAMQKILHSMNFDTQDTRAAISFINGEFWGFLNIRERYDKHYLKRVYDIDENDIDLLTDNQEVKMGDAVHYNQMLDYLSANDMSVPYHYNQIKKQIDIENFADYQIANIFIRNTDWPEKNIDYWRKRTNFYISHAPYGHDGRWRWLLYDTDHGFGLANIPHGQAYNHNTLNHATDTGSWATFILRSLLENADFQLYFIHRYADMLNTIFCHTYTLPIIDSIKAIYEPFQQEHIDRWQNRPAHINQWHDEAQIMRQFAIMRPETQRLHLRNKFNLGDDFILTVNVSDTLHGYVKVNTIDICSSTAGINSPAYPWYGRYFKNLPLSLTAVARSGYTFSHWEGISAQHSSFVGAFHADTVAVKAFFVPDTLTHPDSTFIHFWHFNKTEESADIFLADTSKVGMGYIRYLGHGSAVADIVDDGTELNAILNKPAGKALRVRNPSAGKQLTLSVPTTGYKDISLSYAVKRTTNGAHNHVVQYKTANGWASIGHTAHVTTSYRLFTVDFSSIPEAENNPDFQIRFLFFGKNADALSGNNRFDNILLAGMPSACTPTLAHYFHFNTLDTTELTAIEADYSITNSIAVISYSGTGAGYMDMVTEGSRINRQLEAKEGRALRVRNPSHERALQICLPTDSLYHVFLSYATKRTTNGATAQIIEYKKDSMAIWEGTGDTINVTENYTMQFIDFSHIKAAHNNPDFQVRIRFAGDNTQASSGNNRFDNISLHGKKLEVDTISAILCQGSVYYFYDRPLTQSGFYTHILKNTDGCDSSMVVLDLDVRSHVTVNTVTVCDTFVNFDGKVITNSGIYPYTFTNSAACDSIVYYDVRVVEIDTSVSAEGSVLYASPNNAYTYQWVDCTDTSAISGANAHFFSPEVDGSYAVIIQKDSCTQMSPCIAVANVKIETKDFISPQAVIYPNPASGIFNVDIRSQEILQELYVHVYNSLGQKVYTRKLQPGQTEKTISLDLAKHADGIYVLKLIYAGDLGTQTFLLIKAQSQ